MGDAANHPGAIISREIIRSFLDRIYEISRRYQIVALNRQIEACENLLRYDQPIDVAILGQFKAGKSSFLNSLIGQEILPVGAIPVTTAVTRLSFGEAETARVLHFDGTVSPVDLWGLDQYLSEAKNPGNEKNVEVVDIELPSLRKYAGLRLVDTPGLGSIFKYHMETSEEWVPRVGAAFVAISSDRPLSENDLKLIRDLGPHTPRIILLLTKIDLLSPTQQAEVLQFFQESLKREFNRTFPIFLFSTRKQTEELKRQIEESLLGQLSRDRDLERSQILRHKLQSLGRTSLGYLEIALKASMQAESDREELRRLIFDDKVNYENMRQEISRLIRENTLQTRSLIARRLEKHEEPLLKIKLMEQLAQAMPSWKGNLWRLTQCYEAWIRERMTEELIQVSKKEYRHFLGTLQKAHLGLSRSYGIFRQLLAANVEKVLGLKLPDAEWKIDLSDPHHPDIRFSQTFDYHFELIWFLIPMFFFRRFFERHYLNQIPRAVEINLSRLAAQWEERINKAIEEMKKQALKHIQDELTTIEALLSKTQGRSGEISQAMDEIRGHMERLPIDKEHFRVCHDP